MGAPLDPASVRAPSVNDRSGARFDAMMASLGYHVADAVLVPWHDSLVRSHAEYVARLDAAIEGRAFDGNDTRNEGEE